MLNWHGRCVEEYLMAEAVAIIGMSCRLPGAANEQSLWDLLAAGESAIRPVPADRWPVDGLHHPVSGTPGRTVMRRGGFLDSIDRFDERFFAISPREARAMDPQQRMLLEETWHCLEDAGLKPSSLAGRRVGVFAGVMATDYQQNATQPCGVTDGFSALGTYGAILANRISHCFRWTGPSYTLDAACASSLVALHEARRALLHGDCEMAVVAAANALINPWRSISFSHARMLSADGESRTFDAGANGYVQGEGAVVLLLARTGDMVRLGVRARALVLGSAVNHVGPARGITQPSVSSQRAVIEAALAEAGVPADSISYVEAHGTGTALGDPIEVAALSAALSGYRSAPCGIGALKTNIGHLEAAAGLAGVAKVVLMLERRRLLPTRNLAEVNPLIDFAAGPLRPVTAVTDWVGSPLRAGVSSFGFGGANAHVVLEAVPEPEVVRQKAAATQPFVLSAASPTSLEALRQAMRVVADGAGQDGARLIAVCQTLMQRRDALPYRLAGVVADWTDVAALLAVAAGAPPPPRAPRVVLRFGGIEKLWDSVWLSMLRDLPALAEAYDEAEASARLRGARRSARLVTLVRLHAVGSVLMRAGIVPDLLYGEGIGLWVTLTLAGVVTLADAVAAIGGGGPGPVLPSRPQLAVYDSGTGQVLDPHAVGPGYLAALRQGLDAALPAVTDFAAYGAKLYRANRTFRTFLADWAEAFAIRGMAAPEVLLGTPPADAAACRLLVLAVAVARRRTCARWTIPETGPVLPALADELAHLVAAGALPVDATAALVADAPDVAALSARLDLSTLPPGLVAAALPLLATEAGSPGEMAHPEAWLPGYPGSPRKPAPMPADITLDIGTLGVTPEGQHLALPLGHAFYVGLCQAMCLHWQAGGDTKWSLLAQPHTQVSLPLYPFDRRRHWIPLNHPVSEEVAVPEPLDRPQAEAQPEPAPGDRRTDQIVAGVPTYRLVWSALPGEPEPLPMPLGVLGGPSVLADALPGAVIVDGDDAAMAITAAGCRGLVIGWPLDHPAATPDRAMIEAFEIGCLLPLLKLAKELARRPEKLTIILIGADVGGDTPRFSPALAAASALLKSVATEAPSLLVGAISVLGTDAVRAAVPLLGAALGTPFGEASIRPDGVRVRLLEPVALGNPPGGDRTGAWLIVGGLGGIGGVLASHVRAVHGGPVAVLGRRTAAEAGLAAVAGSGASLYLSADVTDPGAVASAIDRVEAAFGPIGTVVHAEMVLADASVERMTDAAFATAWRPKAYGLATVQAAFAARRPSGALPRTVVFGSILGLTGNAGQANYTAGSAYQMAYADGLAAAGVDMHAIAWGYWGDAGRVADAGYRRRVARIGLEPMATPDALAAFDAVLAGPRPAVVVARLDAGREAALTALPEAKSDISGLDALDTLAAARLHAAFGAAGWFGGLDDPDGAGVAPDQRRLFQAAGAILRRNGWDAAGTPDPDVLSAELRDNRPWLAGVIRLIDTAVPRVVEVLRGTVLGTQVMFPGGEMDLVAGFYAGNRLADAANRLTARRIAELVAERLAAMPADATLRILEVGAGTGATTTPVLDALAPHGGRIAYVFSDLSPAFIRRARRQFGAQRPWFAAARFDFDGDPAGFEDLGSFDLILAANAVHVTADVAGMLDRLSRRLAPGGLLVLNELMRPMDHLTLTFGLLPGWWLAADARAGFGPLLSPDGWRAALADRFDVVSLDGVRDPEGLVQGVLVAAVRAAVAVARPSAATGDDLTAQVAAIVAVVVEAAPDSLAPDTYFADLGLDSILSLELVDRIAEAFAVTLDPSSITENGTAARLAALIAARGGAMTKPVAEPAVVAAPSPALAVVAPASPAVIARTGENRGKVAIIGMAGMLPGADNLAAFMARLAAGATGIGPLPEGRWSAGETAFWGADAIADMKAGFVAAAGQFDAALFGLSAREAILMDPQQRLLLEQAWAALADAGRPHLVDGAAATTGVFVGASAGDWTLKLALAGRTMEAQSLSAQLPSSMAARLSHVFGLEGPAMTVDLACASGLAALHLAVESLGRGECRLALAAGVSLMTTPQFPMLVARAGLLSPSGRPRPFAPDSDGIVLGEGAVVLVLKRLDLARVDGDRIHAVIEGTALSQAGAGDGLSAPNAAAQALTLGRALTAAGASAGDIAAIEAHGVGTVAGDAAEYAALSEVLGARVAQLSFETLKPATGHMLAVSGLAAIARAALAAKGRTLVNGFSLNGACAAVILNAGESGTAHRAVAGPRVIAIGATLEAELYERLGALRTWLLASCPSLADVAAVLGLPRPTAPWRAAFVATDTVALAKAIDGAVATRGDGPDWCIGRGAALAAPSGDGPMVPAARIVAGIPDPAERPAEQPAHPYGYPFISKIFWPVSSCDPVSSHGEDARSSPPHPTEGDPLAVIGRVLALDTPLEAEAVLLDLGIDSILAIEVRNRLASEAGLAVGLGDLLARRPIGAVLATAGSAEAVEQVEPDPDNRGQPFGLTDLQLAYLIGRSPAVPLGGTGCHVYWEFLSATALDAERLERAWNRLVRAHDMLRAVFSADVRQWVQPEVPPTRIGVHDWRAANDGGAADLAELRDRMAHEVFDPTRWPLFRIELSHSSRGSRLHLSIDLLIIDVRSLFGLLRQWGHLYASPEAEVAEPAVSFRDYIGTLERRRDGAAHTRALAFWHDEIARLPDAPALPRARPDQALIGARFVRRHGELDPAAWQRLRTAARACGATPAAVLVAAFGATLAHWTGSDFALNVTVSDRRPVHPDIDRVIGDFTSTVLLAAGPDSIGGFAARASALSTDLARRLEHTSVSGVEALRRFGHGRGVPFVFTSMLGYDPVIGTESGITSLGQLDYGVTQTPQVLLDAQVYTEGGRLVFTWDTVEEAFPDGLIAELFRAYAATIARLAAAEADWGASATIAIAEDEAARRVAINATAAPVSGDLLHEPLIRRALAAPDRIAVIAPDATWTYGDLVRHAVGIAAALPPPNRDELVVVALDKSAMQIAAVLGVLMAGAAYLPLDPGLPAARFRRLVERGEARVVVTTAALAARLSLPNGVAVVIADRLAPGALPTALPMRRADCSDLAYVIFTSGSTGEPKGVMIEHRAALNTVIDVNRRFGVGADDRVLGLSALGFDLSVYDIFGPLAAGGALVLPDPRQIRDPDVLAALTAAAGVTIWNSVPMFLDLLLAAEPSAESLSGLRLAMLSGDWIPLGLPPALAAIAPHVRLVSLGGATEAAIWSICHAVGTLDPAWCSVPYGRPMANQSFHVLDADMGPCPDGVEGELYIGGLGVARGYWRDGERTAAAFVPDPKTGQLLYRTGDMGRWRDGVIEFLGRRDGQVKIGGHRVELAEIEAVTLGHASVGRAVALATPGEAGRRQLVLFVMGSAGADPGPAALRTYLAAELPAYMVPQRIAVVAALPLTGNGKVDRAALLAHIDAPAASLAETTAIPGHASPRRQADLAAAISRIIAEALDGRAVDPDVSFFELGADSLTAVAVNLRLRRDLGLKSSVTDLFEHPSINRLARHFAGGVDGSVARPMQLPAKLPPSATPQDRRAALRRDFRNRADLAQFVSAAPGA
jgi:amino acid adenylation domain-containing protein